VFVVIVIPVPVMITVIPIAFCVPAMSVLVPPSVIGAPAAFAFLPQFLPLMVGLSAPDAMAFDSLIQFAIGLRNPALAIILVRVRQRNSSEHQRNCQGRSSQQATPDE
jgi:hypothetical protein